MAHQEKNTKKTLSHLVSSTSRQASTEVNRQESFDSVQQKDENLKQFPKERKGFADLLQYPELTQFLKKSRKIGKFAVLIMSVAPLTGFLLYASITGNMDINEAIMVGTIVSTIFMFFSISFAIKEKSRQGTWTGSIIDLKREKIYEKVKQYNEVRNVRVEHNIMTIRREDRSKTVVHDFGGSEDIFNYYKVGDRVRHIDGAFHLEKYDKTGDEEVICVMCGGLYDIDHDAKCSFCKLPLLK